MAPLDPHSFIDSYHPLTTDISLSLYLDFPFTTIHSTAFFIQYTIHCLRINPSHRSNFPKTQLPNCKREQIQRDRLVHLKFLDYPRFGTPQRVKPTTQQCECPSPATGDLLWTWRANITAHKSRGTLTKAE
ncbi:hypothetical protein ERO13_D05G365432v2 [Gossypium hirsutum]|nr:hypothetical protein ERO13_D05G365432v2 [Gossypium hirsutum]